MEHTPIENQEAANAAESLSFESPSRHKKIATKSVVCPTAFAVSVSSTKVVEKAEGPGDVTADSNDVDIFEEDMDMEVPPARPVRRSTPVRSKKRVVASASSARKKPKRRLQRIPSATKTKKSPATKKVKPKVNAFWEIESILDVRKHGSSYEYLVKWVGDYENTWEPQKNLNSSALLEAMELRNEFELRESGVAAE